MADQTRLVTLLKAVSGTPSLVAVVLLAEDVVVALLAASAGLAAGWLTAALVVLPGAGLLGSAGALSVTPSTVGVVTAVALGVAVDATYVPAVHAAVADLTPHRVRFERYDGFDQDELGIQRGPDGPPDRVVH